MKTKTLTLRLYRDKKRELRWTLISANGRKLADSGESYKRRGAMEKSVMLVLCGDSPFATTLCELTEVRPDIRIEDEIA